MNRLKLLWLRMLKKYKAIMPRKWRKIETFTMPGKWKVKLKFRVKYYTTGEGNNPIHCWVGTWSNGQRAAIWEDKEPIPEYNILTYKGKRYNIRFDEPDGYDTFTGAPDSVVRFMEARDE